MFDNSVISRPNPTKPHICKLFGYWRVSPIPKPYAKYRAAFDAAHAFVNKMNAS